MRADAVLYRFFLGFPFLGNPELVVRKVEIVPHMAHEEVVSKRGKRERGELRHHLMGLLVRPRDEATGW